MWRWWLTKTRFILFGSETKKKESKKSENVFVVVVVDLFVGIWFYVCECVEKGIVKSWIKSRVMNEQSNKITNIQSKISITQ